MTERVDISFELGPLRGIVVAEPMLSWFRLTDGTFDVRVGSVSLYRAAPDGVSYYVARIWEDLVGVESYALEAVPAPIAGMIDDLQRWTATIEDLMERSPGETRPGGALAWWTNRLIDSSYLSNGAEFVFVRVGSDVRVMQTLAGNTASVVTVDAQQLSEEISSFDRRLIRLMANRIDETEGSRLVPSSTVDELRLDHEDRAEYRSRSLSHHIPTDWPSVMGSLERLKIL